jgi:hypothetical protein
MPFDTWCAIPRPWQVFPSDGPVSAMPARRRVAFESTCSWHRCTYPCEGWGSYCAPYQQFLRPLTQHSDDRTECVRLHLHFAAGTWPYQQHMHPLAHCSHDHTEPRPYCLRLRLGKLPSVSLAVPTLSPTQERAPCGAGCLSRFSSSARTGSSSGHRGYLCSRPGTRT